MCFILRNYITKIVSKSPNRNLVRLQGELKRNEKERIYVFFIQGKGKVIPLQARCGPDGG